MGRLFALCAIGIICALTIYGQFSLSRMPSGSFGLAGFNTGNDLRVMTVGQIQPGSPAARAGIVRGDQVRARVSRAVSFLFPAPISILKADVEHRGIHRNVTLVAETAYLPRYPTDYVIFASGLVCAALSFLLVWRRWNDPVVRPVILYLALQAATLAARFPNFIFGYVGALFLPANFVSYAALTRFTAMYPQQVAPSLLRRRLASWAPMITVLIGVGFGLLWILSNMLNFPTPVPRSAYRYATIVCAEALPLAGLLSGLLTATTTEKRLLGILLAFFALSVSGPTIYDIMLATNPLLQPQEVRPLLATLLVLPLGFVYLILRHRMFDIGFVLNRAAVYAVLTTIFVPLFGLLEWLAERYVSSRNFAENAILQVGITLLLFVAIRRFHSYVEIFVDQWLFRERHENEMAMRDFARHVLMMKDRQAVADQTVSLVHSRTGASWTALYIEADQGSKYVLQSNVGNGMLPAAIPAHDFAIIAMQSDGQPVDHFRDAALADALLLPFTAQAHFAGFVACGPKQSREMYAPDERSALVEISRSVGIVFDRLRLRMLEDETAQLRDEVRRLSNLVSRPV